MATSIGGGTSRYAQQDPRTVAATTDNRVSSVGSGSTVTSGATSQNSSQSSTQNSRQTQTQNSTTRNMSAANEAALNRLIQQLMNGGTPEMQRQRAQRESVLANTQNLQEAYSKPNAFIDAQGLISQQMRRVLEQIMPSINRAAEDAGSSGGALRALLMQDAANKAAESSSALGVQTAVNYGNISTNLSQVLEALTRSDPTIASALINALNASKGAVVTTSGTVTTEGQQTANQVGSVNQTSAQVSNTNENKNVNTDYAPFAQNNTPQFFGEMPPIDITKFVGSSAYNMGQLRGEPAPWSSYKF